MSNQDVKFLDLDALTPKEVIKIKFNGKEHEMKQMTVEDFIWATSEAELRSEDADNAEAMIGAMIDVLSRQFPTVEREDFRSMSFDKLSALLDFTRKLASEGSEAAVAEAAAEGKVEMKPMEEETP